MARPPDTSWKVLPSDPPVQLADNLWRVEGDIEGMSIRRCMVVARLRAGGMTATHKMSLTK